MKELTRKKIQNRIFQVLIVTFCLNVIAANGQTSSQFSNSRTGFSVSSELVNPLSYNSDLNMVAFAHRLPTSTGTYGWSTVGITSPNSSNVIVRYSSNNGTSWQGASLFLGPSLPGPRYPSGVIANSYGNTDAANAKFVATGPLINSSAAFDGSWFASRSCNQTGNSMSSDMKKYSASLDSINSICRGTYFSGTAITTRGNEVWSLGTFIDTNNAQTGVAIFKGNYGAAFTWQRVDINGINDWDTTNNGTKCAFDSKPKIAFSPDGLIGYILCKGIRNDAIGNATKSMQPHVWKTIDGGVTWFKVNDNYDWKLNHPELLNNLMPANGTQEVYPNFFDLHGGEITVDNTGCLHYISSIVPNPFSSLDSLFQIVNHRGFGYSKYNKLDRPWIWHFTTNGNGNWDARYVADLFTKNVLSSDAGFITIDGTNVFGYSNGIKVSRTNDGTKLFIAWTDGDTTLTKVGPVNSYEINKNPNLYYVGYDVTSGNYSNIQSVGADLSASALGFYLFHTSEIVMPSANGFTIPLVYIRSTDASYNLINAVDYFYINDLEVNNSSYTVNHPLNAAPICGHNLNLTSNGISTICLGSNAPLSVINYDSCTYQWYLNNVMLPGTNSSSYIAQQPGVYHVKMTDTSSCVSMSATLTLVNDTSAIPVAIISPAGIFDTCPQTSFNLTANYDVNNTYQWYLNGYPITAATSTNYMAQDSGLYSVRVTNLNGCQIFSDTTEIRYFSTQVSTIFPMDSISLCQGEIVSFYANTAAELIYEWRRNNIAIPNSDTSVFQTAQTGNYSVSITDTNLCSSVSLSTLFNNIDVLNPICNLVYPGDANYDGIANNNDLLEIGLGFGMNGTSRSNVSNSWQGYLSSPWGTDTVSTGHNLKHADCNGDGVINSDDTLAINLNYGLTHTLRIANQNHITTTGDIYFGSAQTIYGTNQNVAIDVYLGESTTPLNNFYGAVFTIDYNDNTLIQSGSMTFSIDDNTWVGSINTDAIRIIKTMEASETIDGAICRTNHTNTNGFGKIGTLRFTSASTDGSFSVSASNAYYIDNEGSQTPLTSATYSVAISSSVSIQNYSSTSNISIYPNPNNGSFTINNLNPKEEYQLEVKDVLGRTVYADALKNVGTNTSIKLNHAPGIYWLQLSSKSETETLKIIIE